MKESSTTAKRNPQLLFTGIALLAQALKVAATYIDVIKNPLWVIQRQVQDLQKPTASINRIVQLFAEQPTILDGGDSEIPVGALAVQFENVSFAYADDPDTHVLCEVDFTLKAGQMLGLLGRTGSGKRTMTRLLFRFYDPTSGVIRLGDAALVAG